MLKLLHSHGSRSPLPEWFLLLGCAGGRVVHAGHCTPRAGAPPPRRAPGGLANEAAPHTPSLTRPGVQQGG